MNRNHETAARLKQARSSARISRAKFAELIGKSPRTVSRIESGEIAITIELIDLYSKYTGINNDHLFHGSEPLRQAINNVRELHQILLGTIYKAESDLSIRIKEVEDQFIGTWGAPYANYDPDPAPE